MKIPAANDFEVPIIQPEEGKIPLFMPHVPRNAAQHVAHTLQTRWIGQGPKVEYFEKEFSSRFAKGAESIAVGSGTDALHLAYRLAGLKAGDEVLTPLFTCTATNIPFLYMGVRPNFVDVEPDTLNFSVEDARRRVTEKTKAIVVVHYGGLPCEMDGVKSLALEFGIPVIEDAAHALGAEYRGNPIGAISDYTMFSFQAIKHITTGDGGMLTISDSSKRDLAESLRWFGIDRAKKQGGIWENDITEIGYKYQMTDVGAALGIAALEEWDETLAHRRTLLKTYIEELDGLSDVRILSRPNEHSRHAAWLMTIAVDKRVGLQRKLFEHGIEANQVHFRNDRYTIFGGRRTDFPVMDSIEENYLVLPLHTRMSIEDVQRVVETIKSGW